MIRFKISYDFWLSTRCVINSKGLFFKNLNFEWNYSQLKFKPGTVEKNKSTIGSLAGIEPIKISYNFHNLDCMAELRVFRKSPSFIYNLSQHEI